MVLRLVFLAFQLNMKHGCLHLISLTRSCHISLKIFSKRGSRQILPDLPIFRSATLDNRATMSSTKEASSKLQPLLVTLSALHLPPGISALHRLIGTEVSLPKSQTNAPINFKAIVSESTDRSLLLKSFYDANVRGKVFDRTKYALSSLADYGTSRCLFRTTFGIVAGQPSMNDKTAPQFKVDGVSIVPFSHQGYFFSPTFLICDHIFCRQEYETEYVAVLGLDFLAEYFIRAQSNGNGWRIQLPPHPPTQISELPIYTDGCCLSNGVATGDPEGKPARGGYGIHFPTLPHGWDMYGALSSGDSHTNQKAELTAVIRALQLVRRRNISCAKISIFTDSNYAVQGLNDWIPRLWRSNGYRNAKNRPVVNADLFKSLDEEVSLSRNRDIPVTLSHVPREENKKADALSKLGAGSGEPSIKLGDSNKRSSEQPEIAATGESSTGSKKAAKGETNGNNEQDDRPGLLLGKDLFEDMKPLLQWSPDGVYWAETHSVTLGMEALIV